MVDRRAAALAIILVSYFMIVLDISIVITGLPKILESLSFSATGLSWVQNAYTLAFGGLLLLGARAGDILGRRRMFIAGLALFTAASLGVGIAQSAAWLIAARALQGVGAAILAPSTLALLTTNFREGPERTRSLAYYAAVAGVGASVGLVLGGIVAGWLSWRVGAYAARVLYLGAMMGFWFFTTQFLQRVLGYGPFAAGLAFLPTTIPNFAAAMMVPRLTRRFGNARLLAGGLTLTLFGMAWLSRLSADSAYLTGVALPMILIGIGQGAVLGPLTVAGVAGVRSEDAGAGSGLVNVTHQLGGSLGLSILVVVFAAAASGPVDAPELLAQRIAAALTAGTVMLALAVVVVVALIVRPTRQRASRALESNA